MVEFVIGFLLGAVIGAGVALVVVLIGRRAAARQADAAVARMRETFAALAGEALDANSARLARQAAETLEGKKALIDQSVRAVAERLEQVRSLLQQVEAERKQDFGRLSGSVASLAVTAGKLHEMLASTQRRGAWGERMAEDVLRLAGLQEGINYAKQSAADAASGRPDFTFFLPNDLKVNMDVKFPLERYKSYIDAEDDQARSAELGRLVQAVRGHIRAVASRGYIDPKAPTVPYVIVFLPSEQVFSLVLQAEPDLVDEALSRRVVLASPLTLYAMLSIIRQAAEHANVTRTADEIVRLLGEFMGQWDKYNQEMDKLGERIDSAVRQYRLVSQRRTNVLLRPLEKISQLRSASSMEGLGDPPARPG
ncbi:MAG: DNA recombination protein RmuC [Planctomycetes bacterium]|nr:DNA recombination protein RmuC [Planctomycetota bacterium]